MTQNNRGAVLSDLATLGEEDRGARLREALAAYEQALRFRTPEAAPLDYAMTQNNRGAVLSDLATLGEEDRGARLREALAAYEQALRFYTPEAAPLDYAMTHGNLLNLYQTMADLPEENRRARLADALHAGWIAFDLFGRLQHSYYQQQAARQLRGLRSACSADFDELWQELAVGPLPEWLDQSGDDRRSPALPADLKARLDTAGVTDEASLQQALDADPALKRDFEAFAAAAMLQRLLETFLAVPNFDGLVQFWQQVPLELEDPFIAAVEQQIGLAEQQGNTELARALQQRLEGVKQIQIMQREQAAEELDSLNQVFFDFLNARSLEDLRRLLDEHPLLLSDSVEPFFATLLERYADDQGSLAQIESRRALLHACRDQGVEVVFAQMQQELEQTQQVQPFQHALDHYLELHKTAEADAQNAEAWRAAVEAGEVLLAPELAETPGVSWEALRANLASTYNMLGNSLDERDKEQALAAFERAIELQPDFAMWRRNRAGTADRTWAAGRSRGRDRAGGRAGAGRAASGRIGRSIAAGAQRHACKRTGV